jgi:small subunit ribosomal protein S16
MLSIRLQRLGRKKYPVYRIVVQQSHLAPTSGKIVKLIGRYNPHTKELVVDKDEANKYLSCGAQPTQRVARLMVSEGVKMPAWFKFDEKQSGKIKNPEKLRKNQPKEEAAPAPQEAPAEETASEEPAQEEPKAEEAPKEAEAEAPAEESTPTEEKPKEA